MGSAGTIGPIQEITERLANIVRDQPDPTARSIRDEARKVVHSITKNHVDRVRALDPKEQNVPTGEVVLVSARGEPCICHIHPDGYFEEEARYCAVGSSMLYAELLLRDYYREDLTADEGKIVAFWTIKNSSEVDTFVGGPIQIKAVYPDRIKDVPQEEIQALLDDYSLRKEILRDLFQHWPSVQTQILKLLDEAKKAGEKPDK